MKSQKKTISQKDKRHELEILEKACEMERNFQKACEMADGFPPPKSEEDFQFLEKWLFHDFLKLKYPTATSTLPSKNLQEKSLSASSRAFTMTKNFK